MSVINNTIAETTKEKEHVHTYRKHPTRKGYSYCLGGKCYSIMETKLLVGKVNRCKCGTEFVLTREDLRRSIPKCVNCSSTRSAVHFKKGKQLVDTILNEEGLSFNTDRPNPSPVDKEREYVKAEILSSFTKARELHLSDDEDL